MIFEYIAIGVIVACIAVICFLVIRKFPMIAAINTEKLPKHKHEKVKQGLMEERLKRKLSAFNFKQTFEKQAGNEPRESWFSKFQVVVRDLEKKYRQKVEELEPAQENGLEKKTSIVLEEAKKFYDLENFKEAESKYIEAISLDPKSIKAYKGLAEVYNAMKDYVHAKETYQFIIKLNASDDGIYDHLGQIARQEGKLEEAEKDFLQSLSLNNTVAGYHIDLGDVYVAMGDFKKAMSSYEEAIKLEPNNPRHLDSAIQTAISMKNKEAAEKYLNKLRESNPANEKISELQKEIDNL
jgi:tetratricopeptide (TPR) repeat protein